MSKPEVVLSKETGPIAGYVSAESTKVKESGDGAYVDAVFEAVGAAKAQALCDMVGHSVRVTKMIGAKPDITHPHDGTLISMSAKAKPGDVPSLKATIRGALLLQRLVGSDVRVEMPQRELPIEGKA